MANSKFLGKSEEFFGVEFLCMRLRIHAAYLPHTGRIGCRIHGRIPSLFRKHGETPKIEHLTCAMASKMARSQGFLWLFAWNSKRSFA